MPADSGCRGGSGGGEYECEWVTSEWVLSALRGERGDTVLIDCRDSEEYAAGHVRSAVNLCIPSIMMRRLIAGKIDLAGTVQCLGLRDRIRRCAAEGALLLYGTTSVPGTEQGSGTGGRTDQLHSLLHRRLKQDGVRVLCLKDNFEEFKQQYPEWCSEALSDRQQPQLPLLGLRSLRISSGLYSDDKASSGSSSDCEDIHDRGSRSYYHQDFPVEILPNLFVGNSANSEDCEGLAKNNIKYILNVTQDLPNVFEASDSEINYLKIPVADHWNQNLAVHFAKAIEFIEEGVSTNQGVLVHCVAGISRSVTVTVAYLMQRHRLNLNDAFALVRSRKADVAPNFHFMRQLHYFERDLGLDKESRSLSKVLEEIGIGSTGSMMTRRQDSSDIKGPPDSGFDRRTPGGSAGGPNSTISTRPSQSMYSLTVGVSPDSGIEFDRWGGTQDTPQ